MRLAKIKNKYLFKSNNPNGTHTYAVYYDRSSKCYRAVPLTHLYVKDEKRFKQVKKGNIMVMSFKDFDTPSGVKNSFHDKTIENLKIDLKDKNIVYLSKRHLPKSQSDKIKKFAKRREK